MPKLSWLSSLFAALVVATFALGCGGNNGGGGSTTGGPAGANMTAQELQLAMDALAAINAHRAGKGITPAYQWYATGAQVAYQHCVAMEQGGFFAHTNPNTGSTPASRSMAAGIMHDSQGFLEPGTGHPVVGENLADAQGTPTVTFTGQQAVTGWVNSPGHHAQLDAPVIVPGQGQWPAWTHCGIGVRVTPTHIWYTAMFWRNPTP